MSFEEKMKKSAPPQGELKDDELEEVSGGKMMPACYMIPCRCPTCNSTLHTVVGSQCPLCGANGITSYMVKA